MATFQRISCRFVCSGLVLNAPKDIIKPGGFARLTNVRSYTDGTIEVRPGTELVTTLPGPVHSIFRLNDPTPFAGVSSLRLYGVGGDLYAANIDGSALSILDSGYSGDPLTAVPIQPVDANQPYMYVVDSNRMRKLTTDRILYGVGIEAPKTAPTANLQRLGINLISQFDFVGILAGTQASQLQGITRVGTSVSNILYDTGSAPGYASIVPASTSGLAANMLVQIGGILGEQVALTQATIPVAPTTVAAIIYDAGTTGMCTIQPSGSLGTGQLQTPGFADYFAAFGLPLVQLTQDAPGSAFGTSHQTGFLPPVPGGNLPTNQIGATINQPDFPVNCLVQIGFEIVRIQSIAVGRDGVLSFRCSTTSNHVVNETIRGVSAFRAWLNGTWTAGAQISDGAMRFVVTPAEVNPQTTPPSPATATAGIRTRALFGPLNLAYIEGRATLPGDDVRLNVRLSDCVTTQTIRIYLSLNQNFGTGISPADFTENYYFFEWRQSDLATAIQRTNADATATLEEARAIVLQNQQLTGPLSLPTNQGLHIADVYEAAYQRVIALNQQRADLSNPLALGNNQWLELRCKVKDLIRVGTDPTTNLGRVTAAEVLVTVTSPNVNSPGFPVTVDVDALWLSGGFDPEAGSGSPYIWVYRYRSSVTGVRSNPSPSSRGVVQPQRQSIVVKGVVSPDPQVDLVDWFRFGGGIPGSLPMYVGTTPNTNPPTFTDEFSDTEVLGSGELVDFNQFQLWPSTGADQSGMVNVSGTAVTLVTGDPFSLDWVPGSQIRINGEPYTLYARPPSTLFLEVVENIGALFNVPYTVSSPAVLKQNQPTFWGPFQGFYFSVGDPTNPGVLKWTNGNDADTTSLGYSLQVTNPSEPLINGFIWDGVNFVWSSEQLYRIEQDFSNPNLFRAYLTPCGRGLWSTWAFCITPQGVVFLAKDGMNITNGGSPAVSITNADLYRLFPHDGVPGDAVNGYLPPDMTQAAGLRLSYVDGYVYFDFAVAS